MTPSIFENPEMWFKLFVLLRRNMKGWQGATISGCWSIFIDCEVDDTAYRLKYAYDACEDEVWMRITINKVSYKGVVFPRYDRDVLLDFTVSYAFIMAVKEEKGTAGNEFELMNHNKFNHLEMPENLSADRIELIEHIIMRIFLENDMVRAA